MTTISEQEVPLSDISSERIKSSNSSIYNGSEGALVLGRKNPKCKPYHTRFAIERKQQNHESFKESVEEFFFPCCSKESKEESIVRRILMCLTAEPFILCIHLLAVILGVLKILLEVREKNGETFEEAHSALECVGVCLVLGLRAWIIINFFHDIKSLRISVEKAEEKHSVRGRKLKIFVRIYAGIMFFFCLTAIGCTILFKHLAHLGWTILSNNCLLAMGTALYGVAESFTARKLSKIKEDHHKVLIYEMSLLLYEVHKCKNNYERKEMAEKVKLFLSALQDTPEFNKPEYLNCDKNAKIGEASITQLISFV